LPLSVAVTVYPVMGVPPVDDGAEKVTHTSVFDLRDRAVSAGAPGTVAKVTGDDATDAPESPAVFFAVAVTV
jgi:hypothetical protein